MVQDSAILTIADQ